MKSELENEFKEKTVTAEEAVQVVRSGDTVYVGATSSVAYVLCEALGRRADEIEDVTIGCALISRPMKILNHPNFRCRSFFLGPYERESLRAGTSDFDYTSEHFSKIDLWCRETLCANVAFLEVSPPDENGYMNLGPTGIGIHGFVMDTAKIIVAQINENVPYVFGEHNTIHISQVDYVVCANSELPEDKRIPASEAVDQIAGYIVDQIPDGACIQLGLGGVSEAVGYKLHCKNDLGIHTELMTSSMGELMKAGVVNNSRKAFVPGKTVAGSALGSKEFYRFLDRNPQVCFMPLTTVNQPAVIAQNDHMISINTAISIDLLGQVCADHINGCQYSGVGGQLDFVRGAQMSRGGKSFIAIESKTENKKLGRVSKIVSRFPAGAVVTTPRSDVQYVVTEFGCVNLQPLSMKDRVRAMIGLAHPDFRASLRQEAEQFGML